MKSKVKLSNRETNEEYAKHLIRVVDDLLEILSEGLGLEKQVLKESVGGDGLEYLLKINYYPKCPRPDLALGVVAHTDMSAITILIPNEVPGLQVFKDDHWFDAKYVPNALVVHIGDQIEVRFIMLLALVDLNISCLTLGFHSLHCLLLLPLTFFF